MEDVWRSARSAHLQAYCREHGLPDADAAPAVIVQRMVPAVATVGLAPTEVADDDALRRAWRSASPP